MYVAVMSQRLNARETDGDATPGGNTGAVRSRPARTYRAWAAANRGRC